MYPHGGNSGLSDIHKRSCASGKNRELDFAVFPCNRATVLHDIMNVTMKVPDELCKAARQRAVDAEKSLSANVAELLARDLEKPVEKSPRPKTWMDAFSGDKDDRYQETDFSLEDRKAMKIKEFDFEA